MSARYGSRTRSGEAVSDLGRRVVATASGGQTFYEQEFTAPGTWSWPGNVTHVEVLLVGGGGGAGYSPPTVYGGSGGGGGVRWELDVPVTGPQPVTVGSGGTGGASGVPSTVGGDSTFGPLSVGGGGAGKPTTTADAPPIGGGGGGPFSPASPPANRPGGAGGLYGVSINFTAAEPGWGAGAGGRWTGDNDTLSDGSRLGFGAFGRHANQNGIMGPSIQVFDGTASRANTGNGGNSNQSLGGNGSDGGSGIVIVRWWE